MLYPHFRHFRSMGFALSLFSSSPLWAACPKSDLLSRTLALLYPQALKADEASCLQQEFQAALDQEKDMGGRGRVDSFSRSEIAEESSALGSQIYSVRNTVDLKAYARGAEIYGAHKKMILGAKEEILLQTFVWESESRAAKAIFEGLTGLADQRKADCERGDDPASCTPLPVVFIVNYGPAAIQDIKAFITNKPAKSSKEDLLKGLAKLKLDPRVLDVRVFEHRHEALGLMHAKDIIVDGQVAMVTGANVQRFNDPGINWYDTGYIVAGDVARGLRTDFINNVLRSHVGGERDGDQELARRLRLPYDKAFAYMQDPSAYMERPYDADGNGIPMIITSRDAVGNPSNSNNSTQNRGFQAAFYGAKDHIRIQTPNLNDDAALRGLSQALMRNVDVNLVLSRRFNCKTENMMGQGGDNTNGVKIIGQFSGLNPSRNSQFDARWFAFKRDGVRIVPNDNMRASGPKDRPGNSHAKYLSVDDELVIVGSSNQDTQSWNQSRELNIMIFDKATTQAWDEQVFLANFEIGSSVMEHEIDAAGESCDP